MLFPEFCCFTGIFGQAGYLASFHQNICHYHQYGNHHTQDQNIFTHSPKLPGILIILYAR